MSRVAELGNRLYNGQVSYDFVGRAKVWYAVSAAILLLSLGAILVRGFDLGIDFEGGSELTVTSTEAVEVDTAEQVLGDAGLTGRVQTIGGDSVRVQVSELSQTATTELQQDLAEAYGVTTENVSASFVGPTWGEDVSRAALRALVIFLALVVVYLSITFEWKMAVAAIVALLHDVLITAGIYALVGFEVTPATVIGLLTILGYSLYDTVVVFDKVRENTAGVTGGSRYTYSEAANLAVNQTLVRSINTSVIALLPIGAILFVGAGLLGAGTLKDLALALFVGVAAGTFSSIFIATPLLAQMKEREPQMQALAARVAQRRAGVAKAAATGGRTTTTGDASSAAQTTALLVDEGDAAGSGGGAARAARTGGPRQQPRRLSREDRRRPGGSSRH